jgi:regulator of cell morphogenesis and NO signaling
MQTTPNTVAELAVTMPQSISVLEKLGIDYCCNGHQSIEKACRAHGISTDELLGLINAAPAPAAESQAWTDEPMSAVIRFIVDTHHRYTRDALDILRPLATKVAGVHGANHAELRLVDKLVYELADDLIPHMMKEEQVLFPYVEALEEASLAGGDPPVPFFGTARNPVRMMMLEHETVGEKLLEIRTITKNFELPGEACTSYRVLFAKLEELEQDIHRHIHLENNILFPRAIAAEESARGE